MAEAAQIQSRLSTGRSPHCCFEYTRLPPAACPSRITQKADKFPPCYIITMAGISTLVGSGATAILSSVYWNDVAGGFAIGQYILGAGAIAITCVLQIHGKTCACWTKWVTDLMYTHQSWLVNVTLECFANNVLWVLHSAQSVKTCAHVAMRCPYHGALLESSASKASISRHTQTDVTYWAHPSAPIAVLSCQSSFSAPD